MSYDGGKVVVQYLVIGSVDTTMDSVKVVKVMTLMVLSRLANGF